MEANKGEAIRAANVAQKFIGQGDLDKAKKFLEKSIKLYPLPEAQALLHKINSGVPMATNAGKENNPNGTRSTSAGVRQRKAAKKEEPAAPVRPFTKEQQAAVNRIKQSKDFYDILGVARNADDATIKKAYRKLALKLHPDKNSAPGADEAFKEVSRAWTVLSDSHKRAHYDRFGSDEAPARQYQQRYHDEIDPEEIFNMFFGSGFGAAMGGPGVRMYRFGGDQRRRNGGGGHQQQHQGESGIFSMEKSGSYPVMRKTKTAGVYPDIPFFVDTSFNARYARDRRTLSQIERQVEGEYVKVLKRGCQLDRKAKDRAVYEARRSRNAQRLKQANELGVPRCEQLDKVQSHVGY